MVRDELSILSAFLAVAEERSFRGQTTGRLDLGVEPRDARLKNRSACLLARTTRSVAPTDAGEQFIARLRPALADVRGALDRSPDATPAGRVRLLMPRPRRRRCARSSACLPAPSGRDARATTDSSRLDLVAAGLMPASSLSSSHGHHGGPARLPSRAIIACRYFASHETEDARSPPHRCINFHGATACIGGSSRAQSLVVAVTAR